MTSLHDDLGAENHLLRRIIEVTSADLDMHDVANRVAALVTEATASDVCFVHLVDEERERVVLTGATPPFDDQVGKVELKLGEGIAGWVALHAEPAVVPDKWKDPRYRYIPALRGQDFTAMISVPLVGRAQRVVGVLNVHSKAARTYEARDLALLTRVADLMARAVENVRLYQRLAEREELLEHFAARTVDAQEHERRRLAGDVHDGISQRLISLWYHLLAAEAADDDQAARRHELEQAKGLASAALDEAHTAIAALRPSVLDDLGLGPSLESLAHTMPGTDVEVDIEPCRLPPHVEVALYRIAQEALQNVAKHAEAPHAAVRLRTDAHAIQLTVRDDGRGFEPGAGAASGERIAYGLVGMRERAELIGARLTVRSEPGSGTTVEVVVPNGDAPR